MNNTDAKESVKVIFEIIGFIGLVMFIAPYFVVLIFGGEFTFSSDGAIPQLKQLWKVFRG